MRRPPLTKKVLSGLLGVCGFIEAGSPGDYIGYEPDDDDLEPELRAYAKRIWSEFESAAQWVDRSASWWAEKHNGKWPGEEA